MMLLVEVFLIARLVIEAALLALGAAIAAIWIVFETVGYGGALLLVAIDCGWLKTRRGLQDRLKPCAPSLRRSA